MNLFAERLTDRFVGNPRLNSAALVETMGMDDYMAVDTSVEVENG
jgi:hypothetical protein